MYAQLFYIQPADSVYTYNNIISCKCNIIFYSVYTRKKRAHDEKLFKLIGKEFTV